MPNCRSLWIVATSALALVVGGCDQQKSVSQAKAPPPPTEVTVSRPLVQTISETSDFVGRFVAVDSIEIRARVSGHLEQILFRDGSLVKKGQLLFNIDRRPFAATLEQAKATLEQAKANLAFAQSNLERGQNLQRGTVISDQTLDQRVQAERVAYSAVAAQEAAVKQAELDLQYTELRAPVSGRIGDRRVSEGNLVTGGSGGNTTLLATIKSTDPIRFEFTIDEATYLRFLALNGEKVLSNPNVPVALQLINEDTFGHHGHIDFVDNTFDRSSGVIRMRAEFPNPAGKFTPGMFGRIRLQIAPPAEALLIPDTAVGTEQVRKFVFVVGDKDGNKVAEPHYVKLGPLAGGLRVVRDGITRDDLVVISGIMKTRPGMPISPKEGVIATASNADMDASKRN
ncbi:MAG TPA: efflux RND transporter periplasmic adaptor subunit [Hyphomicrobiaceae bacterium]|nr:efflux RND transporter periplasmic adaptor subunit [Hyphomicrobiaceae bacterium]